MLFIHLDPVLTHLAALVAMVSTDLLIPALAFIGQTHAAPINLFAALYDASPLKDLSPRSPACNDIHSCRTLLSIIYGCLATIFACTWVSYHPDVPNRTHSACRVRAVHFLAVVISFLVPELTVAKAASQWWHLSTHESPIQGTY